MSSAKERCSGSPPAPHTPTNRMARYALAPIARWAAQHSCQLQAEKRAASSKPCLASYMRQLTNVAVAQVQSAQRAQRGQPAGQVLQLAPPQ